MTTGLRNGRSGFALLVVLWVMVAVALIASALNLVARGAVGVALNRVSLARAEWHADGCIASAHAAIDRALRGARSADSAWSALDSVSLVLPFAECEVALAPTGARLNVNDAVESELRAFLVANAVSSSTSDSLAAAVADWRDADNDARPLGAERDWYERNGHGIPRNAALVDVAELEYVRGWRKVLASRPQLLGALSVERERIVLARAPLPVIAALPGIGAEALARIQRRRLLGTRVVDLGAIADELSPQGRAMLIAHYSELAQRVATTPEFWTLTARARSGDPTVEAVIELRLAPGGRQAAVVRRRSWP